jgi:non-specific serine/threonine protein kinase/serine/threonine-protein kinase
MDRSDEARQLGERLLAATRQRYGDESMKTFNAISELANAELVHGDFARAEALLAPVMPVMERVLGADHPFTAINAGNMGSALIQQGRNEEALPWMQRAYDQLLKTLGPDSRSTLLYEHNLAAVLRDMGQLELALQHARHATERFEATLHDNPERANPRVMLASILLRMGRYPEAERELTTSWDILTASKEYDPTESSLLWVANIFIKLYTAWHKPDKVAQWRAKTSTTPVTDGAQTH